MSKKNNKYDQFLDNIEDPAEKMVKENKIPVDYKLIHNMTKEIWSYENENGDLSEIFKSKDEALLSIWNEKYLNESSKENGMVGEAIDILSLTNTRITDSSITSKLEKIINELSSIQRKIK